MDWLRRHTRAEEGTTIIEVIVAAAVLLFVAGAIVGLVSAAQRDSGEQRVQAIATDLAQSQLEEMRSLKFAQLVGMDVTTPDVIAGGVRFTVRRQTNWAMQTSGGAGPCSANNRGAEALRATTTVTWNGMRRRPVVLDTLIAAPPGAAPNRGAYTVQINDRNGTGVANVAVTMTGPSTMTGTTDATGCVRFAELLSGSYDLTFHRAGWITPTYEGPVSRSVTVVAGQTGSSAFEYDAAGTARVRFLVGNTSTPAAAFGVLFRQGGVTRTGTLSPDRTQGDSAALSLYPSASQYEVHADTCATSSVGQVAVPQGGATNPRADVRMPQARVQVQDMDSHSIDMTGFRARFVTQCGSTTADLTGTTSGGGRYKDWTSAYVALPPGNLQKACVFAAMGGTYFWGFTTSATLAASDLNGKTIQLGSGATIHGPGTYAQVCT